MSYTYRIRDLKKLLSALSEVASKWMVLGEGLGLTHKQLSAIQSDHGGNPNKCLERVLSIWLESDGPTTREKLETALSHPEVKGKTVAESLPKPITEESFLDTLQFITDILTPERIDKLKQGLKEGYNILKRGLQDVLREVDLQNKEEHDKVERKDKKYKHVFNGLVLVLAIHFMFILSATIRGIATYQAAMFLVVHLGISVSVIFVVIYMPTGKNPRFNLLCLGAFIAGSGFLLSAYMGGKEITTYNAALFLLVHFGISACIIFIVIYIPTGTNSTFNLLMLCSFVIGLLLSAYMRGYESQVSGVDNFSDFGRNYMDFASFSYKGKFLKWSWRKHGLGIKMEEEKLPSNIHDLQVNVTAILMKKFVLPKNKKSASTFFHIQSDYKFQRKVWIKIWHFASNISTLSFGISYDKHPPYRFQLLQGGQFFNDYGIIEKRSFSTIGIVCDSDTVPYYYASIYSSVQYINTWYIYLFITVNNPTKRDYLKEYADSKSQGLDNNIETLFTIREGINELTMNISLTDEEKRNGWYLPDQATMKIAIVKGMISTTLLPAEAVFHISRNETSTSILKHNFILEGAKQVNHLLVHLPFETGATKEQKKTVPRHSSYFSSDHKYHGKLISTDPHFGLKLDAVHNHGINGYGTKIAIIDSCDNRHIKGIQITHKTLQTKFSHKLIKLKKIECADDTSHALVCTSIAVGEAFSDAQYVNDKRDIVKVLYPGGIAPQAEATVFLVNFNNGNTIIKALDSVIRGNFDVLSMSFGCDEDDDEFSKRLLKLKEKTIIVAAAGNKGNSVPVSFPARHNDVISVGSLDENFKVSSFSAENKNVDIFYYGEVMTPFIDDTTLKFSTGTSIATPGIAGSVSLLVQIAKKHGYAAEIKQKWNVIKLLYQVVVEEQPGIYKPSVDFLIKAFSNKTYFEEVLFDPFCPA